MDIIALTINEACRVSGLGRTKLYDLIKDGRIKARKLDKRTLIVRSDLEAYLNGLPTIGGDTPNGRA
jgi:excisionase family DNA binding protein